MAIGRTHCRKKRIVVGFDEDTFAEINAIAERDKVSFAEAVRMAVEWGLESASAS